MTTLKKLLEKKGFSDTYMTDDLETINEIKLIKMVIKEWLQQKRQDRINKIVRAKKNILSIEERTIINSFYNELLDELK